MKQTLMSVHICSMDKVDKSLMLSVFLGFKLWLGFIPCSEKEAEQTYQLVYERNEVCSWLSLSGMHWHDDPFESERDACGLAGDNRMGTVYFNVATDGSALFAITDPFCHKAGMMTTGKDIPYSYPDSYFDKEQKTEYWTEFTNSLASQTEFEDALNSQYSSAEEMASALTSLLHIKSDTLLLDVKYSEPPKDVITMYFKAAPTDEKKLTVKTAFKKIYGEALRPLGYVYAKTKEPCFIRVVNNELIHIIGMKDMKNKFFTFAGIASLYRADLGLDHTYRDMSYWLPHSWDYYYKTRSDSDEAADPRLGAQFRYWLNHPESVRYSMKSSLDATLRWVLPVLEKVDSLSAILDYNEKIQTKLRFCAFPFPDWGCSDAPIQYLLPGLAEKFEEYAARINTDMEEFEAKWINTDSENYMKFKNEQRREDLQKLQKSVYAFLEDTDTRQQIFDELERRKNANLEKLHSYGVI